MRRSIQFFAFATIAASGASLGLGDEAERQLNVSQGPEAVFSEEPGQIFPELAEATPTGVNGRVGNELVFWGFSVPDRGDVYLVACAMLRDVDCEERESRVCPAQTVVLACGVGRGLVREIDCVSIATVGRVSCGPVAPTPSARGNLP